MVEVTPTAALEHDRVVGSEREDPSPVTVIGLGLMGSALAGAFLDGGHPTTVWNRSPEKADDLVGRGALRAATVDDAIAASGVVVVCVLDYKTVREVLDPVADGLAGRTLVNLTSGTPDQARETARWAAERGVDYLDGAIMSIPAGIGQPETLLLYGGPQALFEAQRRTLMRLGGATTHVGADPGLALVYDTALLGLMYSTLTGFIHALALVGTERIEATTFTPFATKLLAEVTGWLPDFARQVEDRHYPGDDATLAMQAVGMTHFIRSYQDRGIDAVPLKYLKTLIDRRVAEGHGADGIASLIEVVGSRRQAVGSGGGDVEGGRRPTSVEF